MINSLFGNVNNIVHFGCNTQVFEKPLKLNKENTLLQNVLLGRTSQWRNEHRTIHVQYKQAESGCLLPILEVVTMINVAKCNLGKAKIQPMLVACLCLTGVYGSPLKRM